ANGEQQTRQITNVAAGTADTDAVNVAQLQAGQTHYYSVQKDTVRGTGGNFDNDGASGDGAIAIGEDASASGPYAFAAGFNANATGGNVAIGPDVTSSGVGSVAIGTTE